MDLCQWRRLWSFLVCAVAVPCAAQQIPLREGLTVVTAISELEGDYESVKRIVSVDGTSVSLSVTADVPDGPSLKARRRVLRKDLEASHDYRQAFAEEEPETHAGSTALGTSRAVLEELKQTGESGFTCDAGGLVAGISAMVDSLLSSFPGVATKEREELRAQSRLAGTLKLVGMAMIPVLVNDQRVKLQAVHARGVLGQQEAEFYFLDDPANPLSLKWNIGGESLQVILITYPEDTRSGPTDAMAQRIEQSLASSGRAEIHGIYFGFGSATLRPESEEALRAITAALAGNPDWKVSIEGHTDNIGEESFNLDLSLRRAEAVRLALVERYRIPNNRLTTTGFGEAHPKEPNDSMEGRAGNRRVELVRK